MTNREQSDSRTPDFKLPPRHMINAAKAGRARLKACHGNWHTCESEHPERAPR